MTLAQRSRVAALVAVLATVASGVSAFDGAVDFTFQSAFVWRGIVLDDSPVFQPSVTVSDRGFTASVWGNGNLARGDGAVREINEIDYLVTYTRPGQTVDVSVTWYDYTFPHDPAFATQEVWLNATFKRSSFSPSVTLVRDVKRVNGWYLLLSGSHPLGLWRSRTSDGLVLTLNVGRASGDYARSYFEWSGRSSATDYGLRLDWPVKVGPGTLKLNLQYADFTDAAMRTPGFDRRGANLFGGVGYSVSF